MIPVYCFLLLSSTANNWVCISHERILATVGWDDPFRRFSRFILNGHVQATSLSTPTSSSWPHIHPPLLLTKLQRKRVMPNRQLCPERVPDLITRSRFLINERTPHPTPYDVVCCHLGTFFRQDKKCLYCNYSELQVFHNRYDSFFNTLTSFLNS